MKDMQGSGNLPPTADCSLPPLERLPWPVSCIFPERYFVHIQACTYVCVSETHFKKKSQTFWQGTWCGAQSQSPGTGITSHPGVPKLSLLNRSWLSMTGATFSFWWVKTRNVIAWPCDNFISCLPWYLNPTQRQGTESSQTPLSLERKWLSLTCSLSMEGLGELWKQLSLSLQRGPF